MLTLYIYVEIFARQVCDAHIVSFRIFWVLQGFHADDWCAYVAKFLHVIIRIACLAFFPPIFTFLRWITLLLVYRSPELALAYVLFTSPNNKWLHVIFTTLCFRFPMVAMLTLYIYVEIFARQVRDAHIVSFRIFWVLQGFHADDCFLPCASFITRANYSC